MASRFVPTTRIRLGFHLCGDGIFEQVAGYSWPFIFEGDNSGTPGQYVPVPTNSEKTSVSSFGQSAFFDFAAGTNFAGGIKVRMAQFPYNYGEVKIPDSSYHDFYLSPSYDSNDSNVIGRYDIYWDYDTNYPGGFQIMVNSGNPSGFYRGISDVSNATPGTVTMRINGHGPDGTTNTTYFQDGGSVGNLLIQIPWADINAVNNIYVYFGEPVEVTTTPAPTTAPPSCFAVSVLRGRNAINACCNPISDTHYFNAPTVEAATISYGTSTDCSTPNPINTHYSVAGQYYISTGGVMSGPFPCPSCE